MGAAARSTLFAIQVNRSEWLENVYLMETPQKVHASKETREFIDGRSDDASEVLRRGCPCGWRIKGIFCVGLASEYCGTKYGACLKIFLSLDLIPILFYLFIAHNFL